MKPCKDCPWIHAKELLSPVTRGAAIKGSWFCCHKNMGTCYGAQQYGEAKRKQREKVKA